MTTPTMMVEIANKKFVRVVDFYDYLDALFDLESDSDTLFAGGYLRGFISLVATEFGDESQLISQPLLLGVSDKVTQAKTELSPQDHAIVTNFWIQIQCCVDDQHG
jgi:hypothetical protein